MLANIEKLTSFPVCRKYIKSDVATKVDDSTVALIVLEPIMLMLAAETAAIVTADDAMLTVSKVVFGSAA